MTVRKPLYIDYANGAPYTKELPNTDSIEVSGLKLTSLSTGILHADASGVLSSSLVVDADVNAAAAIAGTKISPNFGSQAVTTSGNMSTTGSGTLSSAGDFSVASTKFTVSATSGNTSVGGTLTSNSSLTVSNGAFTVGASKFTASAATGNTTVGGTLGVTGASTLTSLTASGNVSVTGSSTLTVQGLGGSAGIAHLSSAGLFSNSLLVNADVASNAAIAYSKLNLASSITSSDIVDGTIVNGDINASAAIDGTKISPNFGSQAVTTSGNLSTTGSGTLSVGGTSTLSGAVTFTTGLGANLPAGGYKITGLADPTNAQDAATKSYVDGVATGLDIKGSVRAATTANITLSGAQTIDGVSIVAGDRVLVKNQSTASANGIYVAASGSWSRAADADSDAEVTAGMFCFVEEGSSYADTGWVLSTDNPITLGTTALAFTQFSSAGVVEAGNGLTKTGNSLDVGAGDGIAVSADSIAVDLASNKGLEFSSAKLQIKAYNGIALDANGIQVDLAADKGLEFSAGKLQVKKYNGIALDSNGLQVDLATDSGLEFSAGKLQVKAVANQTSHTANGLEVLGVPAQFKIDGSAVSANVTAANLGTLTAGASSDAKSLHMHSAEVSYLAQAASEASGDIVAIDSAGKAAKTDSTGNGWAIGVVESVASGSCRVVRSGLCAGVLSGATAGTPYYMSSAGVLSSSLPASGRVVLMGFAASASDLMVQVRDFGQRSA